MLNKYFWYLYRSSELSRVGDPLRSIEIDSDDIMFDATGEITI